MIASFFSSSVASGEVLTPVSAMANIRCPRPNTLRNNGICNLLPLGRNKSIILDMAVIHISEAEAMLDFAGLLARVRAGEEIVIEKEASPAVLLRVAASPLRQLSESLRLAREHASLVTLDGTFARDLEAVINSHPEPLENLWD